MLFRAVTRAMSRNTQSLKLSFLNGITTVEPAFPNLDRLDLRTVLDVQFGGRGVEHGFIASVLFGVEQKTETFAGTATRGTQHPTVRNDGLPSQLLQYHRPVWHRFSQVVAGSDDDRDKRSWHHTLCCGLNGNLFGYKHLGHSDADPELVYYSHGTSGQQIDQAWVRSRSISSTTPRKVVEVSN